MDYTVEYWRAHSLAEFFDVLLKKKRVCSALAVRCRVHCFSNLPFEQTVAETALVEDDDGVRAIVTLTFRTVYEEEEAASAFFAPYLFRTWRVWQANGTLNQVLEFFFNELDGDFAKAQHALFDLRAKFHKQQQQLDLDADEYGLALALDGGAFREEDEKFGVEISGLSYTAKRFAWCRLLYWVGKYIGGESAWKLSNEKT